MSTSSLPPTQNAPQIFLNPDGTPLSVFTQAEGILGRPRIAKLLKKGGATISKDPKDADVVLVNDQTPMGKQFIRVWSRDGNKVVLRYEWVAACVEAGKILKEEVGWGGFVTVDDGLPIEDLEDASETEQKSVHSNLYNACADPVYCKKPTAYTSSKSCEPTNSNGAAVPSKAFPVKLKASCIQWHAKGLGKATSRIQLVVKEVVIFAGPNLDSEIRIVSIGYPRRAELVTSIKKHGGAIEASLVDANFVILFANLGRNSKDYQNYLQSAVSAGVPAIRGQFIQDCIEKGKILDYKYYTFDPPSTAKKVKPKVKRVAEHFSSSDSEEEPLSRKLKQSQSSQPNKRVKRTATPSTSQPKPSSKPSLPRPSPKPVPTQPVAPTAKQAYKYTAGELEIALSIAFEVCKKNPDATEHEVAVAIHKQVGREFSESKLAPHFLKQIPHHTLRSWRTYMGQVKKSDFAEARKKGGIAYRKEKARQESQQRQQTPKVQQEVQQGPQQQMNGSTSTDQLDVETFSDFLAFHGGDQLSGENQQAAFEALSKMAPSRTAAGWEQFWGRYNAQITERYHPKAAEQMEREQKAADDLYAD
ncbi:hypothetical protein MD484_g140, partial [Candolleomyces efflorescens]